MVDRLAAAFAEWEREYREEPEAFWSTEQLAIVKLEDYGKQAAATLRRYMVKLVSGTGPRRV